MLSVYWIVTCIVEHCIGQHGHEQQAETGASPLYRGVSALNRSKEYGQPNMSIIEPLLKKQLKDPIEVVEVVR